MKGIRIIFVVQIVFFVFLSYVNIKEVKGLAPPRIRQRPAITSEEGRDYLALEEDDEEFPEESIRQLRKMAESFRSGLASSLTQGGAAAQGAQGAAEPRSGDGGGGGEDDGGGDEGPGGSGSSGQVMKYIMQIVKGFQQMRKSMSDMFQQIATSGGQRLAQRIQNRLSGWVRQGPSQLSAASKPIKDQAEAVKKQAEAPADPLESPAAGRVPF